LFEPERFRSAAYRNVIDEHASALTVHIDTACVQQMEKIAEAGYPYEICGLLIGSLDANGWLVRDVRQVANLNEERAADRFMLDPAAYQQIDRELRGSGKEIIGVFHSHPDCPARPSPTDRENAWEGFLYPIVSVCDGRARATDYWALNDEIGRFQRVNRDDICS